MKNIKLYKNITWQFLLQAIRYLFPFVLLPYLTRIFGMEGYSSYVYVVSFAVFVQLLVEFGFNLTATKYFSQTRDKYAKVEINTNILISRLLISSFVISASVIAALEIPILYNNFEFTLLMTIAACIRGMWPDYIFLAYENLGPITVRFFLARSLAVIPVFLLVKSFNQINVIGILEVISALVSLIWSYYTAHKLFGIGIARTGFGINKIFGYIKDTFPCCISNVAANSTSGLTTLILGVSGLALAEISYWSLAVTAVAAVQALFVPINNALYPHIVNNNDIDFVKRISIYALPALFLLTLVFCIESDLIIKIIGGDDYLSGAFVFYWISPTIVFSFYAMIYGWPVLGAKGNVKKVALTSVISSVFCFISLLLFAIFFNVNLIGICLIRCLSELLLMCSRLFLCFKLKLV